MSDVPSTAAASTLTSFAMQAGTAVVLTDRKLLAVLSGIGRHFV